MPWAGGERKASLAHTNQQEPKCSNNGELLQVAVPPQKQEVVPG